MSVIRLWLRRRRLLREAAALEREARRARRSLAAELMSVHPALWFVALAGAAAVGYAEWRQKGSAAGPALQAIRDTLLRGDAFRAADLEAQAAALRAEAGLEAVAPQKVGLK